MKFFVFGHDTLMGRTFVNRLSELKHEVSSCDSREQDVKVDDDCAYAVHAGGPTMGITGNNKYPADLMTMNVESTLKLIRALPQHTKMLYLASSCCYPVAERECCEADFGKPPFEPVSSYYATAKTMLVKLCQAYRKQHKRRFICAVPTNVFGPHDDVSPESSHVVMGIMAKLVAAKEKRDKIVTMNGSGKPARELMYAQDAVDACLFLLRGYDDDDVVNVSNANVMSISTLAEQISFVVGYTGQLVWDRTKPDGAPYKALCRQKLLGLMEDASWQQAHTPFNKALERTYGWYIEFLRSGEST